MNENLLKEGRTKSLFINVFNSFFVKAFSVLVTFMLIPVSIRFVNKEDYGLWLTISSVITFASLLDLGLANGLKNKLAESFANKEESLARTYLSTTYALLLFVISTVWILFYVISVQIDWQKLFNTSLDASSLKLSLQLVFGSFCISFILQPITALLMAKQKHYLITIIQLCGNGLALIAILFFGSHFKSSAFLFLAVTLSFSYPVVLLIFTIVLFKSQFPSILPSFADVKFKYCSGLFDLGIKFFIIQIAVLIIYYSNNLIISRLLGNEFVTIYNIAFRYFSIVTIVHSIVIIPLWTAFTDAYVLHDYNWITKIVAKVNKLSALLCIVLVLMCMCSNFIYRIWIGPTFTVPLELNILLAISAGIGLYAETYIMFINGTGKINWQMYFSIIAALLHVPAAYFLVKLLGLGLPGIVTLSIIWTSIATALWYIQYKHILSNRTDLTAIPKLIAEKKLN